MPTLRTQTVSTKVTQDDYAFARFARRPSSSLDLANGGLAQRAPSVKVAVTPTQGRRLADPAGFLSSTGPLTAVLGSQRGTAYRGIGTTENGDDGPC